MNLELNNKVAFIAGSSRGIGLGIARAFLREGAKVAISGRNKQTLEEAKNSLVEEANLNNIHAVNGDMTEPANIRRALKETIDAFGGIDAVVANIGSGTARGGWELTERDWQSVLNVNLLGSMALTNAALHHLIDRGGGNLIFIASITGIEAMDAPVPYTAAKAALLSAMKSLSRLVGTYGVRVNAVAPGNIFFPGGTWEAKLSERREYFENYIKSEVPLQRFGKPEEIGDAVVFLASERASFITGACLVVDGGQTRAY